GATFECALGMPYSFTACTSPKAYPSLSDGRYAFAVRARTATSLDDSPAEAAFTVDTTAPTVTLMGPAEGSTAGRNATFTYTAEAGASFDCALDSTSLLGCFASGKTFELLSGGDHIFRIRATDAVGNVGAILTRNFKVDAVAPTVTITHFTNDQSMVSGTVAFTAGET